MSNYSLSFWNLLKETKTDKNKFVREASLACLKKFGEILKESPEVMESLKGGKSGQGKGKNKRVGIRKKGKNKAFFKKGEEEEEGSQKRRTKKMNNHSSKELIVKGSPGMRESNSGRLDSGGGKKDSQMRGKIVNKKMNLKNVKGRLNVAKLKKEFAKKNRGKSKEKKEDDIEIVFKEPTEKIDYEKWMNEEEKDLTEFKMKEKPRKLKPKKKKKKPSFREIENERVSEPEDQGFEIHIAVPAGPNPYAKKKEEIPDQFSEEEEEVKEEVREVELCISGAQFE